MCARASLYRLKFRVGVYEHALHSPSPPPPPPSRRRCRHDDRDLRYLIARTLATRGADIKPLRV